MNALELRLAQAGTAADVPPLPTLIAQLNPGDAVTEVRDSAAGTLAHLACKATVRAMEEDGSIEPDLLTALLAGLSAQQALLALEDAVDVLLESAPFIRHHGQKLCDALLRGHADALHLRPLVATGYLEGALRLAIADAARPFKVLAALEIDDPTQVDPEYAEGLPRLVGAALDRWSADDAVASALRDTLTKLCLVPDAAADAAFEHGLDLIRQAASAQSATAVSLLIRAREQMASAAAADEARDDAELYGAGLDAILAFSRADRELLATSRERIAGLLARREAWLRGLHTPSWRRPRRAAERTWSRLVLILDNAAERLAEPAWLDAWDALASVLEAYELDRSVSPVIGTAQLTGFEAIVRPTVEKALVQQQSLLATLRHAAQKAETATAPRLPLRQLQALRDRIDALAERPDHHHSGSAREPQDTSEAEQAARDDLIMKAPALFSRLGEHKAKQVVTGISDDVLNLVEGIAHQSLTQPAGGPIVDALARKISNGLAACPDYTGITRQYFDLLTWEATTFLAARHDLQLVGDLAYLKPFSPGHAPREQALQNDYADWLRRGHLAGLIQVEVSNIATGRVDIQVSFGSIRFYVEIKRELDDATNDGLEKSYLTQAADYSGTNATLGQLLVLDLTTHPDGVRHLTECAWIATQRPSGSKVDRYVMVGIVLGNRDTPRSYSQ